MSVSEYDAQHPPSHWDLLVELRVMQETMKNFNTILSTSLNTHNDFKKEIDNLKIRVTQLFTVAAILTFAAPYIINRINPETTHSHSTERLR